MTKLAQDSNFFPVQALRPTTTSVVAIGAASAKSGAMAATTTTVRLMATSDCHVAIGPQGTVAATASSMLMAANQPEYFAVLAGDGVAVIQATAAGSLYVTEC